MTFEVGDEGQSKPCEADLRMKGACVLAATRAWPANGWRRGTGRESHLTSPAGGLSSVQPES